MNYELSNAFLTVGLKTEGAELTSVKSKDGLEYMWCGDKKYWGRHAPVLFPIVGKVMDNEYAVDGKTFHLTQHGFARDSDFKVVSHTNDKITFSLAASDATLEKYPFNFELQITYTLKERTVEVKYTVINKDNKEMPFSIGAHPAFNCPLVAGESFEDYYIEFEKEENAVKLLTTPEVTLTGKTESFKTKEIPMTREFFKDDAVILADVKSDWIALKSRKNDHSVVVFRKEMPFTGLWSPVGGAPFVCIEPWAGHTDYVGSSKELAEKKDVHKLAAGRNFEVQYEISFN